MDQRITTDIRKYCKPTNSEDLLYQKSWATANTMLREKFITLTVFTIKVDKLKSIKFHLKTQENSKSNPKNVERRKQ